MERDKLSPDDTEDGVTDRSNASEQNSRMTNWENQGARPKSSGNEISESMLKERVKPLHEDTGPSLIHDAWDTLCIKDVSSGTLIDVSSEIDPCLVQRLFEDDHEKQTFYTRVKRYANYIEIKACKVIEIELKDTSMDVEDVVKKALVGNISVEETIENVNELDEILTNIETLSMVKDKIVRIYRKRSNPTLIRVVGLQADVEDVKIDIAELKKRCREREDQVGLCFREQYDEKRVEFLRKLQFQQFLDENNIDVDISFSDTCHVILKAKDEQSLDTAKSALPAFIENVKIKDINLPRGARWLIGHDSRKTYNFITKQLQKEKIRAFLVETDSIKTGKEDVKVCGLGDDNTDNAVKLVQNCIIGKFTPGSITAKLRDFLKTHEGSIIMVDEIEDINCLCYSLDLQESVFILLSDIEKEIENTKEEDEYICNNHAFQILKDVGCLAELRNNFPSIHIRSTETNPTKILVSGSENDRQDAKKELLQLEQRVQVIEIVLESCKLELLQQEDQKALKYVQNRLKKIHLHLDVTDEVKIYSLDGKHTREAEQNINDSVIATRAAKRYIEDDEEWNKMFERHNGCISIKRVSNDVAQLCYTDDLHAEIDRLTQRSSQKATTVSIECKPFIKNFLKHYGKAYIEGLENTHKVRVSYVDGKCCFSGNIKDVESFRQELNYKFPGTQVCFITNKDLETYIASTEGQHKLDVIAQNNKCCWGINAQTDDEEGEEKTLSDKGICARWIWGDFSRTISLVLDYKIGNPDMVVYPVNTNMFAEYAWDITKSGNVDLIKACTDGTLGKKQDIGKVKIVTKGLNQVKCQALAAVVICDTTSHVDAQRKPIIGYHELEQSIQTILSEATRRKMKSVVFPLPTINYDSSFTPVFFTEAIFTGMMDFYKTHNSSHLHHIYLSGEQSVMDSAFNSAENHLKSKPSVRRQMNCLDQGLFNKSKQLHFEVQVKSIFDAKAECIVVAISKSLDLKEGLLSGLLLEKASKDIQAQLSLKHQLNLKEGEYVVLSTKIKGNKCIRRVILGYIPKWQKSHSSNVVQTFVKECCFAAEQEGCCSIGFPALGTGVLAYPQREVAKMMLDGIQQYNKETMSGNIKQIFITLESAEDPVYGAFQSEQRRTYADTDLKILPVKSFGYPQIVSDTNPMIKVLDKSNLPTLMPSRFIAIDCKVRGKETSSPFEIQRSSEGMSDRIELVCIDQYQSFERAISRVLEISEEDRATAILFHTTHELSFSAADQVNTIVDSILKAKNIIYLSDVVISTEDVAGFDCVQNSLYTNRAPSLMLMSFFQTKNFLKQPQWSLMRRETSRIKTLTIQLIGVDKKALDTASDKMEIFLKSHHTAFDKTATMEPEDDNYENEDQAPTTDKQRLSTLSPSATVGQTIQWSIEDDSVSGGQQKIAESLDTYVAIENIPESYTLKKLRSVVCVRSLPIALPELVYMDGLTSGIAICNSKEDAKQLVGFNGIPGIRFKPQPKNSTKMTATLEHKESKHVQDNYNTVSANLQEIHVKLRKNELGQFTLLTLTSYQLELANKMIENSRRYRNNECVEKIENVTGKVWDIIKMAKSDKYKLIEKMDVSVSETDGDIIFSWESVSNEDDNTIIDCIFVFKSLATTLKNKEIQEIELVMTDGKLCCATDVNDWCDEIEFFGSCCIHIPQLHVVIAYCNTYDEICRVKHFFDVKTGLVKLVGRRKRQINEADDNNEKTIEYKHASVFNWSKHAKNVKTYVTKEGIIVKVYEANITNLPVHCIVNAANDNLQHGGGIARVIAKAAGNELTREGNAYIREKGRIPVGLSCTTTAGHLPYKFVIHAVGPRWDDYIPHDLKKVQEVEDLLHLAITNSFMEAETRKLDSIAFPALSIGIFAVPEELCVYQYARAIVDYSRKSVTASRPLREIHFIDKNQGLILKIQRMFKVMIADGTYSDYDINTFVKYKPPASKSKWYNFIFNNKKDVYNNQLTSVDSKHNPKSTEQSQQLNMQCKTSMTESRQVLKSTSDADRLGQNREMDGERNRDETLPRQVETERQVALEEQRTVQTDKAHSNVERTDKLGEKREQKQYERFEIEREEIEDEERQRSDESKQSIDETFWNSNKQQMRVYTTKLNEIPKKTIRGLSRSNVSPNLTLGFQPGPTAANDISENIETVFASRIERGHAHNDQINVSSQVDDIADSDILGSIITTHQVVEVASRSDMVGSIKASKPDFGSANTSEMLGSITTTKPIIKGATASDMLGSITTTKPIVQGATGSDMLGSISKTQSNVQSISDSSDEEEDIQLDTFSIIIRCKKRRGGHSTLVLKTRNTEEALKWRYIFRNNNQHRVTNKLQNVCKFNNLRMDSNVAEIECENTKPLAIEDNIKSIITQEIIDLRVTDFSIETEECQRVVDVLTRNCPAFTDQTVSLFMERARCYLVSPAHIFEANIEVFQQTRDFLSTTLGSQPTKRKK